MYFHVTRRKISCSGVFIYFSILLNSLICAKDSKKTAIEHNINDF